MTRAEDHHHASSSKLVQIVRQNTAQFIDVNNVKGAGYQRLFGCVSGPDHGAMGIHYVNLGLVGDGLLDEHTPEALIYGPSAMRAAWLGWNTSWMPRPGWQPMTIIRRNSKGRTSSSWMLPIALEFPTGSSNCTSGPGGIIQTALTRIGTTM